MFFFEKWWVGLPVSPKNLRNQSGPLKSKDLTNMVFLHVPTECNGIWPPNLGPVVGAHTHQDHALDASTRNLIILVMHKISQLVVACS